MRWLITGGCGFIGRNLISYLLRRSEEEHHILVLDNLSENTLDDMNVVSEISEVHVVSWLEDLWPKSTGHINVVVGDVKDASIVAYCAEDADVIVHLAANTGVAPSVENPRADCLTNVIGTLNCLEAARKSGVSRFVFASSGAPAGICEPPITETIAPRPASPYGASKLAGEGYCSAYFNSFGVQTTALRFSNVYGSYSGRKGSVVAAFIRRALDKKPLVVYGDGSQTRDFVYVDDLVEAIRLGAVTTGVGGEVFQIATGIETPINLMLETLRPNLIKAGMPDLHITYEPMRIGDVMRNYADPSKARKGLGWEPAWNLDTGLKKTVEWFKDVWMSSAS